MKKRLKAIASFVDPGDIVLDIGTDHAYLPIYLVQENITKDVLATDISAKVIKTAEKNIAQHGYTNIIKTKVADGFNDLDFKADVAIISGLGTETIMHICQNKNIPDKLIIQSNNKLNILRKFMQDLGYRIVKEIVIWDKYYYDIIKYEKGLDSLTEEEILFGKSNNLEYLEHELKKYQLLYQKSKQDIFLSYINKLEKKIEKLLKENGKGI